VGGRGLHGTRQLMGQTCWWATALVDGPESVKGWVGEACRRQVGIECVWRLAGACHAVMANSRVLLQVRRHMGRQAGGHVHVVWGRVYMRGCIGV